eukprot:COSAG04_NODE_8335_length_988_cov_1.514061_2_plen_308_part_00
MAQGPSRHERFLLSALQAAADLTVLVAVRCGESCTCSLATWTRTVSNYILTLLLSLLSLVPTDCGAAACRSEQRSVLLRRDAQGEERADRRVRPLHSRSHLYDQLLTACACCRRYEVDYGDRAEHCWNGDHDNGNGISRLRYNTMYLERCALPALSGAGLRCMSRSRVLKALGRGQDPGADRGECAARSGHEQLALLSACTVNQQRPVLQWSGTNTHRVSTGAARTPSSSLLAAMGRRRHARSSSYCHGHQIPFSSLSTFGHCARCVSVRQATDGKGGGGGARGGLPGGARYPPHARPPSCPRPTPR